MTNTVIPSMIKISNVSMTEAAAENTGDLTPAGLLALCLDGADPDREQGWREYVAALEAELADCWTTHDVGYSDAEAIEIAAEELGKDPSGLVVVREGSTISVMTIGAAMTARKEPYGTQDSSRALPTACRRATAK